MCTVLKLQHNTHAIAILQGASDDVVEAQIAPSPTDPQPLTEEDIQERDQLLEQGFSNWNRRDFTSFVRACERFGRHAIPEITKEIEGKTEEEVCQLADSQGGAAE